MKHRDGDPLDLLRTRWMGVELRHLASLSAVSRELSFRGAAEKLGYVPSAVSQQISRLEAVVGERLVARSPGGAAVTLTRAGDALAGHAERILQRLEGAEADVSSLDPERSRHLRVGVHQRLPTGLVSSVVRSFTAACPEFRIVPSEAATVAPLLDLIRHGDIDVAFAQLPLPPGPFEYDRLYDDELVLALPPAVAFEPPQSLADLARLPLVWLTVDPPALEPATLEALADVAVAHVDTPRAALALVRAGVGPSILPSSIATSDIETVALSALIPARTVVLAWHAERRLLTGTARFRAVAERLCRGSAGHERRAAASPGALRS